MGSIEFFVDLSHFRPTCERKLMRRSIPEFEHQRSLRARHAPEVAEWVDGRAVVRDVDEVEREKIHAVRDPRLLEKAFHARVGSCYAQGNVECERGPRLRGRVFRAEPETAEREHEDQREDSTESRKTRSLCVERTRPAMPGENVGEPRTNVHGRAAEIDRAHAAGITTSVDAEGVLELGAAPVHEKKFSRFRAAVERAELNALSR